MPNHLRDIVGRMVEAGESDADIAAVIQRFNETHQGAQEPAQDAPQRTWTDTAIDALPAVGGALGGLVGSRLGPVAGSVFAGVGGTAGEGYRQLLQHAGEIPGAIVDVSRNLVSQPGATLRGFAQGAGEGKQAAGLAGGTQGAIEGVGAGTGRLLTRGASRLYQSALKPSVARRLEFPNIVQTGLREGVPVSARGTAKAGRLLTTSTKQADDIIAAAERAGAAPVGARDIVPALRPVRSSARERVALGLADDTPEIAERARAIRRAVPRSKAIPGQPAMAPTRIQTATTFAREPNWRALEFSRREAVQAVPSRELGIPLTRAQALKRQAQDLADTAFRTQERGGTVRAVEPQMNQAVARGLREGIEQRVPGVAPINARTQELIGLTRALEAAEGRVGNTLPQMIGPRMLGGAGLGLGTYAATGDPATTAAAASIPLLFSNPASASNIARLMNRTGQAAPRVTPQAIRVALLAMMSSREPEE